MKETINIFWFRRDLRIHDNAALYHACKEGNKVLPIFIFDTNILDDLEDEDDARVTFIHQAVTALQEELATLGSGLRIFYGTPVQAFETLLQEYYVAKVFANHDYEDYAITRDDTIRKLLAKHSASFHTYKDQVIFEKDEIQKSDQTPYVVFTPYSRKWQEMLQEFYLKPYPVEKYPGAFLRHKDTAVPTLEKMGFRPSQISFPDRSFSDGHFREYEKERNFPALDATSRLGIHLRFGTISIRKLAAAARAKSSTYLNELVWRDFYQMILWQFPHIGKGQSFKKEYDRIEWRNNENEFAAWCAGRTGYPIVDAGMRQLNTTGFMHNRVRMITASFLAKHLLIDWRWGEAYFARRLLDYDFAANNGGWQWAVGSGCDAAPYFRIFNPTLQTKKFDPDLKYIRKWVPEFDQLDYPQPIVNHDFARKRCIEVFSRAVRKQ